MEGKAKDIAEMLKLLANEHRLQILYALRHGPMTVGKIAEHTPHITQSALSQYLTLLKTAGILKSDKLAQHVTYSIADIRVTAVLDVLKRSYCEEPGV